MLVVLVFSADVGRIVFDGVDFGSIENDIFGIVVGGIGANSDRGDVDNIDFGNVGAGSIDVGTIAAINLCFSWLSKMMSIEW